MVAIKRSLFIELHRHRYLENPFREVRLAAMIPLHPNIVEIHEVTYDQESHV